MIFQKEAFFSSVQRRIEEQTRWLEVSHLQEPSIGSEHRPFDDSEFVARYLLTEQVIFSEKRLFVKSADSMERGSIEQHKHSGAERFIEP